MKNYIKKEQQLLKKLKETNYKFFNENKNEALEYLESCLISFPKYENSIINQKKLEPIILKKYHGQETRDRIQELDEKRHNAHEMAIVKLKGLNRLFILHNLEPFSDINTDNRYEVAKFCIQYVNEIYNTNLTQNPNAETPEFDIKKIHQHILKLDEIT